MKNKLRYVTLITSVIATTLVVGKYFTQTNTTTSNVKTLQSERKKSKKAYFDRPNAFSDYFNLIKTKQGETTNHYPANYKTKALAKARKELPLTKKSDLNWIERGPANISGRTRAILVDPDDPQHTWIAGAVSGGIWKTTDSGNTWNDIAPSLPNLSITALASSTSNKAIIYAGTGEGYRNSNAMRGDGLYKSLDGGVTWQTIPSTSNNKNFEYVNKIVVHPSNASNLLVATNKGLYQSTNQGDSWEKVFSKHPTVQDIEIASSDFSTLFITVHSEGLFKSTDAGTTWNNVLTIPSELGRSDLAIAPSEPNKMFLTAVAATYTSSDVYYFSTDIGETWHKVQVEDDAYDQFAAEQGWYDLCSAVNPYNPNELFVAGIYMGKIEVTSEITADPNSIEVTIEQENTDYISFLDFNGNVAEGKISTGPYREFPNVTNSDIRDLEIRFGPGITQKAHRFQVPTNSGTNSDGGSGVPSNQYNYKNYVDIPFQVWDKRNNTQLMVSFRDNLRDGVFNLTPGTNATNTLSREYIYIHNIGYENEANPAITKPGGQTEKTLYFLWPTLKLGQEWLPNSLPNGTVTLNAETGHVYKAKATLISDSKAGTPNGNLHVDHHFLQLIKTNNTSKTFTIINGNDGGLGLSRNNGISWKQITNGYNTSQFYGAGKVVGKEQYLGGTQDNGTYLSGENPTKNSNYSFKLGGDGFEVVCHATNPNMMIGGAYNNLFSRSTDGGQTWQAVRGGLIDDGPFVSRLSASDAAPDVLFAVGGKGVYKSSDFGSSWSVTSIPGDWPKLLDSEIVRVSLADPKIVWAGGGFLPKETGLYLSKDQGKSFSKINNFEPMKHFRFSGIATHPTEPATAYLLFSAQGNSKILKTTDFGKNWTDITQVNISGVSQNGFPDVAVFSLIVMPEELNKIWVGTEIGIFESIDNGDSWHIANNGLQAVPVWQMKIRDNILLCATHGRGIWTLELSEFDITPTITASYKGGLIAEIDIDLLSNVTMAEIYVNGELVETISHLNKGNTLQSILLNEKGIHSVYIKTFYGDRTEVSNTVTVVADLNPVISKLTSVTNTKIAIEYSLLERYTSIEIIIDNNTTALREHNGNLTSLKDTIEIYKKGWHTVTIKGVNTNFSSISKEQFILVEGGNIPTDIQEAEMASLEILPIPSVGNPTISFTSDQVYGNCLVHIIRTNGQMVHQQTFHKSLKKASIYLPQQLGNGNYILYLKSDKNSYSKKFTVIN